MPPPSPPAVASATWSLRLLGDQSLTHPEGHDVPVVGRAPALILARLALYPQRAHAREELIDLLWPDADLDAGRNRLRQALSVLRALLDDRGPAPVFTADRRTVRLSPHRLTSDVQALHDAVAKGDLAQARRLCRGELLPGHFDEWVQDERRALAALVERGMPAPPAHPAVTPAPVAPSRLPAYLTRRVGSAQAATALAQAVSLRRLVVLRGPGGIGKTRLAIEVAGTLDGESPGRFATTRFERVVFVPLVTCATRDTMLDAVWHALRVDGMPGIDMREAVAQALEGRRVLIVLDNFEQLVEVCSDDLAHWLAVLPMLHLLVTSRRALHLDGALEQVLPALAVPGTGASLDELAANPAVTLFVDRARAVRADFALNGANAPHLAELVTLLEGLPLAIELAASRLRGIGLPELLAMLRRAIADEPELALDLLERKGPRAGDDPRHASMRAVMAWSVERLGVDERSMLGTLAAFSGGATLDAAAAARGLDIVRAAAALDELVASSVAYWREGSDGRTRYHLYEPVREFALAGLVGAAGAVERDRHFEWLVGWARSLGESPRPDQLRDEIANIGDGLAHGVAQGRHDEVLALASDLALALDDLTLPGSALDALTSAVTASRGPLVARVHAILAQQRFEQGARDKALAHAEAALRSLDDSHTHAAEILHAAARIRLRLQGDCAAAGALIERALRIAHERSQPRMQAELFALCGIVAMQDGRDVPRKAAFDRQALALWQAHGPPTRVPVGLVNLALSLGFQHKPLEQLPLLMQARQQAASNGQQRLLAFVNSVLGYVQADLRRWDESEAAYRACLDIAWAHAAWREWFYGLWNLPRTLVCQGRAECAALMMGFAEQFGQQRYGLLHWSDRRERRRTRRLLRNRLGVEREQALWHQGSTLSMAQAMRLVTDGSH